jgi:hypothetical protein
VRGDGNAVTHVCNIGALSLSVLKRGVI